MPDREVCITIVATGPEGSGKTRALAWVMRALEAEGSPFQMVEYIPPERRIHGVEVQIIKIALR